MIRRISAAVSLPLVSFGYAIGWYGFRSLLLPWGSSLGVPLDVLTGMYTGMLVASLVGTGLSPLLAAAVGPSATAAVGLAIAAVGCVSLGLAPPALLSGPVLLAGAGVGLFRPAVFAAAARPFSRAESGWTAALVLGIYLAFNSGGALGPWCGAKLYEGTASWLFAVILLGAAGVAAADAAIQSFAPAGAPVESTTVHNPTLCFGVGVAMLTAICAALYGVGWSVQFELLAPVFDQVPLLNLVTQLSLVVVGLLLAVVFVGTAVGGVRMSPPVVGGFGYALAGVFFLPLIANPTEPTLVFPLLVVGAAVEVASFAPALVGAVAGVHWRLSTAMVAIPVAATGMASLVANLGLGTIPHEATIAVVGVSLAVSGLVLACGAFLAERWWADQPSAARVDAA